MKTHKKQKIATTTEKQKKVIKTRAQKLYDFLGEKKLHLIEDDETYVKADFSQLPGQQFYTCTDEETLPEPETTIGMEKFGSKYFVWQAICECGKRNAAFITTGTINREIYIEECLKKRLLPFYRKHKIPTLFWPDLASAHYAKDTLNFMKTKKIQFVAKEMNPPNVPQCRGIETYWAQIKKILRKTQETAIDIDDFAKKWEDASRKIKNVTVEKLMADVRKKLRKEWDK